MNPRIVFTALGLALVSSMHSQNYVLDVLEPEAHVEVGDAVPLDLSDSLTLEAWIKPTEIRMDGSQVIIAKGRDQSGILYHLALNRGRPELGLNDGLGLNVAITSNETLSEDTWTHVAGIYTGKTGSIFVNGKLKKQTGVVIVLPDTSEPLWIGLADIIPDPRAFTGFIDEVRIWNRPLSSGEVRENRFKTLSGQEEGLVAYWPFGANGPVTDITDNQLIGFDQPGTGFLVESIVKMNVFHAVEIEVAPAFGSLGEVQLQVAESVESGEWLDVGEPFLLDSVPTNFFRPAREGKRFYRLVPVETE